LADPSALGSSTAVVTVSIVAAGVVVAGVVVASDAAVSVLSSCSSLSAAFSFFL
jgi:hypothetical protein